MRQKGYLTQQRKVILDIVQNSEDHPSASDVIVRLQEKGYQFAYGTVYNSLRYLSDEGYIHEITIGDGIARYDGRLEEHHHVKCRVCHRIDEVHLEIPFEWIEKTRQSTNYQVEHGRLLFEGICPECIKKSNVNFV